MAISLALRRSIPTTTSAQILSFRLLCSSPLGLVDHNAQPLHHADHLRHGASSATATTSTAEERLGLDDTQRLFASVPSSELVKTALNLHLVACGPLVDAGSKLMASPAIRIPAVHRLVKATVYDQFCAGENVVEAGETLRRMWARGLRGILDYGLEDAEGNADCDRNLQEFIRTVDTTPSLPPSSVSFACVKITAICPIRLLERISDLLRWNHKDPSSHLPWKLDSLPILTDSSPLYHTPSAPLPLSHIEESDLQLAHQRLEILAAKCREMNLPLLVDAEYTSVQPAIDYFTYCASISFNNGDFPIVFGTIQAYLKDAKERIVRVTEEAEKRGIMMGLKLVRGAYISRETKLASSLNSDSPIHSNISETHKCYDSCAAFMLEKVAKGRASVVLATHNLNSGKAAAAKSEELGISKGNKNLHFSQLKGMADSLSLGLKNAGFQVSKYLAFGPLENVIPYLLRRAEENRGLLSASSVDRQLIRKELKRRLNSSLLSGRK